MRLNGLPSWILWGLSNLPLKTHSKKQKTKQWLKKKDGGGATFLLEASSTALQQLSCRPPSPAPYPTTTFCKLLISLNDPPPDPPPIQSAYTCNHVLRPSDRSRPSPTGVEISYHCFEFSTWTGFIESRAGRKRRARELEIGTYFFNGRRKMPDVTAAQCGRLTGE